MKVDKKRYKIINKSPEYWRHLHKCKVLKKRLGSVMKFMSGLSTFGYFDFGLDENQFDFGAAIDNILDNYLEN